MRILIDLSLSEGAHESIGIAITVRLTHNTDCFKVNTPHENDHSRNLTDKTDLHNFASNSRLSNTYDQKPMVEDINSNDEKKRMQSRRIKTFWTYACKQMATIS